MFFLGKLDDGIEHLGVMPGGFMTQTRLEIHLHQGLKLGPGGSGDGAG